MRLKEEEARKELARAEKAAARPKAGLTEVMQVETATTNFQQVQDARQTIAYLPVAEVNRTAGMVKRTVLEFEITDKAALYKVKPDWFDLVPKRSIIRAEITSHTNLPGIRVWQETKIGVRE